MANAQVRLSPEEINIIRLLRFEAVDLEALYVWLKQADIYKMIEEWKEGR